MVLIIYGLICVWSAFQTSGMPFVVCLIRLGVLRSSTLCSTTIASSCINLVWRVSWVPVCWVQPLYLVVRSRGYDEQVAPDICSLFYCGHVYYHNLHSPRLLNYPYVRKDDDRLQVILVRPQRTCFFSLGRYHLSNSTTKLTPLCGKLLGSARKLVGSVRNLFGGESSSSNSSPSSWADSMAMILWSLVVFNWTFCCAVLSCRSFSSLSFSFIATSIWASMSNTPGCVDDLDPFAIEDGTEDDVDESATFESLGGVSKNGSDADIVFIAACHAVLAITFFCIQGFSVFSKTCSRYPHQFARECWEAAGCGKLTLLL